MPSVEIIAIGTEILLGDLIDTNSAHVARELAARSVDVYAKHAVGDNTARITAMLRTSLDRSDGALLTGGLGPTVDDLTREAVAAAFGMPLQLHAPSLAAIEARFASMDRVMTENNRRQAYLPQGATVLPNPNGTAPGFIAVRADGKFAAAMPGVPVEMKAMLGDQIIPWIVARFGLAGGIVTRTLHTSGLGESEVDRRIYELFSSLENPKIAVLAHLGRVDVRIMAKAATRAAAAEAIAPVEAALRERLGSSVFGVDAQTMEGALVERLIARGATLCTAESVTGGGIADAIVSVAGASACFRGGIVAYDNALKESLLGVEAQTIAQHGAVSEEVAVAMAIGARLRMQSDFAVATTGIAGPAGATANKPVGLVWLAVAGPEGVQTHRVLLPGDRAAIRRRAVAAALDAVRRAALAEEGARLRAI